DPDDKFEGAEVRAHKLIDVGSLNFDGDLLTCRGENGFVYLAKRGCRSTLAFKHAEYLIDRFAQFFLDKRDNVSKRGRGDLVLKRAEHGKCLFRQHVGARAEELPKLN